MRFLNIQLLEGLSFLIRVVKDDDANYPHTRGTMIICYHFCLHLKQLLVAET